MVTKVQAAKDNSKIVSRYRTILKAVKGDLSKKEVGEIRKAMNRALDLSQGKPDFLGEAYVFYPMGIARILAKEIGLGRMTLISAFLYLFVKEGRLSLADIKEEFGEQIHTIVDGLVQIPVADSSLSIMQAENFRQFIFTVSKDVRVILIKLAERLYIMRRLHRFNTVQQKAVAEEVSVLYAPLAHRLGLYQIKTELEDLALKYQEPEVFKSIEAKLKKTTSRRNKFIRKFIEPIKEQLLKEHFDFEIQTRAKSIHSIWNKMKSQDVEFEEVYDLFAIRIILHNTLKDEKSDCWSVYSVVTNIYQPNPRRLRDWISVPKSNGYESLHTTVVGPGGKWVEVQIRTERMNEVAEKGLAAHWKYKGGNDNQRLESWMNRVREFLESAETESDLVDQMKLNIYDDEVFVFTPKGDLRKYPKGASVLDFAFDIHSDIGAACTGAKINNRNVPIRHRLHNGDQIEIMTSKTQKPKSDWLEYVITSKAKTKIKQLLRQDQLKEAENGQEMIKRRFKNWKISYNDVNINKLLAFFKLSKAVDLYYNVAVGKIEITEIKEVFDKENGDFHALPNAKEVEHNIEVDKPLKKASTDDFLIIDNQIENVDYKLAKCCNPIMGDPIFGFVTVSEGIKIHRKNCPNAQQLLLRYPYRVVNARWTEADGKASAMYETKIRITGYDDMGIVNNISNIISKDLRVYMRSVSFDSNNGLFDGKISLLVKDKEHLTSLMDKIANVKGVNDVVRYEDFQ